MASSKEDRDRAEAQFHKTLKATWGRKQATTQYEAEARLARDKTSRLKSLRLAKEARRDAANFGCDILIVDTAGRNQIAADLMDEMAARKHA